MATAADSATPRQRLLSLDIVRGLTVAAMILVNCPGSDSVYWWAEHAPWNGCRLADFVFPSFLVIVGISIVIALERRLDSGQSRALVRAQIIRRSGIIFGLGLISSAIMVGTLGFFRIPGVLQRIAVCYFVSALMFVDTSVAAQAWTCATLLIGYWLLLLFVPVPGHGAGDLSPTHNLVFYVDHHVLGNKIFAETTDPEGLLSTLSAIATTLIGVLAGQWLRSQRRLEQRARDFIAAGAVLAVLGLIWSRWLPLNKNIWTSSYAVYASGVALAVFGACYWLVEVRGRQTWGRPFEVFGRNALAAYFLSELFYGVQEFIKMTLAGGRPGNLKLWLDQVLFGWWLSPPSAALAYAVTYVLLCMALMTELYRRRIFIRV